MASTKLCIGVLALQGAFAKHIQMLSRLGVNAIEFRYPEDLVRCDGLIIPGGESTVIMRQFRFIDLEKPFIEFAKTKPVFGTCAGLILMSRNIVDGASGFNLIDVTVERNAFGRQIESFETDVVFSPETGKKSDIPAIFIRAPRIRHVGEKVTVLSRLNDEPVIVQQGIHLGATFHPELTDNSTLHLYFIHNVTKNKEHHG